MTIFIFYWGTIFYITISLYEMILISITIFPTLWLTIPLPIGFWSPTYYTTTQHYATLFYTWAVLALGNTTLTSQYTVNAPNLNKSLLFNIPHAKTTPSLLNLSVCYNTQMYSRLTAVDTPTTCFISPKPSDPTQTFISELAPTNITHHLLSPTWEFIYQTSISDYSVVAIEKSYTLILGLFIFFLKKKIVIIF